MNKFVFHQGLGLLLVTAFGMHAESATPLFEALRQNDIAKVKAAINNGADVNSRDEYGNTLLMQAAVYATASDLDFLLAHGADVNASNKNGHTALMRLCRTWQRSSCWFSTALTLRRPP
jgi:ankyrin repeat protein